jgi:MFS family permease
MKKRPPQNNRGMLALLFVIQFFSWSAMFCLWIYAVPVITQFILRTGSDAQAYRSGLITISACYALYAFLAALLAFVIPRLLRHIRVGTLYGVALLVGAIGMGILGIANAAWALVPAFVAIGIAWSAMSNIPYAVAGAAAPEGSGAHTLRLFGFSTVIPQVVTTFILALGAAPLLGDALNRVMLVGAAMMALGCIVTLSARHRFDLPAENW